MSKFARRQHDDIGHVLLRYSDQPEPASILSREDLSETLMIGKWLFDYL